MPLFESNTHTCSELEARLRLQLLPDIGSQRFHKLVAHFGCARSALDASAVQWRGAGCSDASAQARRDPGIHQSAAAAMAWLERADQHLLMWDQPDYPALLKEIADPPPLLFVRGDPGVLERPQIAVVGSRRASPPGLDNARPSLAAWQVRDSRSPAVWPWVWTVLPTKVHWTWVDIPSRSWAPGWKNFIHRSTVPWRRPSS